jgi:leader peptidase (prepilin peptidase)/N-methyltransferase
VSRSEEVLLEFGETPVELVWFLAAWLFGLGACIGSFMNVVIYRMPAKLPIWMPNSRCPHCLHSIRPSDNIPILSWLLLRAKCRDCHASIPSRYPAVELLVGSLFLLFGLLEGLTRGANLPLGLALGDISIWVIYGTHMMLLCVITCAAFIRFDGHEPPTRLFAAPIAMGFVASGILGGLASSGPLGMSVLAAMLGLLAGGAIGVFATAAAHPRCGGLGGILEWAIIGQILGWYAVCWIAISVAVLAALQTLARGSLTRMPISGLMLVSAAVWLLNWRTIVELVPQWTRDSDPILLGVAVLFAFALSAANMRVPAGVRPVPAAG